MRVVGVRNIRCLISIGSQMNIHVVNLEEESVPELHSKIKAKLATRRRLVVELKSTDNDIERLR